MRNMIFAGLVGLFVVTAAAPAAQQKDKGTILDKSLEEWLKILETSEKTNEKKVVLLLLELGTLDEKGTVRPKLAKVVPAVIVVLQKDKSEELRRIAAKVLGSISPYGVSAGA